MPKNSSRKMLHRIRKAELGIRKSKKVIGSLDPAQTNHASNPRARRLAREGEQKMERDQEMRSE